MKTRQATLLIILCFGQFLFSQNSETTSLGNSSSYVSLNPLPILDIYFPRLRVGYLQNINGKWKIGADIGYGAEFMALDRDLGESYQLFEIRPELYYVLNPKLRTIKYLSVEFFYIDQKNFFVNDDYETEDGTGISFDSADYTRKKYGLHLKFGLFMDIGKNLGINFYGGVGFRIKNNQYTNVINPIETGIFREWFSRPQDVEGKNFNVNPTLGLKFYYKL